VLDTLRLILGMGFDILNYVESQQCVHSVVHIHLRAPVVMVVVVVVVVVAAAAAARRWWWCWWWLWWWW
jgi:hypothetical protein